MGKKINAILPAAAFVVFTACQTGGNEKKQTGMKDFQKGSFGYDLDFLKSKDSVIVLSSSAGNAQVIVSPKY